MNAKESNKKWEDFVNNYISNHFKNLEIWQPKRQAAESIGNDTFIFNYIKFPKAENGSILTIELVKFIIQSIESDDNVCENIFGPAYTKGSAEIVIDEPQDISIIWNRKSYTEELLDIEDPNEYKACIHRLYNWDIFLGAPTNLSPEEIERRKKIDTEMRRMSIILKDPNLNPDNKTEKEMEQIYKNYNWNKI